MMINQIVEAVMKNQEQFIEEMEFNKNNPPKNRPDQKFKINDKVSVTGWSSTKQFGTIKNVDWIFHHRLGEYTWGYFIEFDEGYKNPLTFSYIPQGYITKE